MVQAMRTAWSANRHTSELFAGRLRFFAFSLPKCSGARVSRYLRDLDPGSTYCAR